MSASAKPMLRSLGKPLEHKSFVLREKGSGFLGNSSLSPPPSFILISLKISSVREQHQPSTSLSRVPKSEMSLALRGRVVEKLALTCLCSSSFPGQNRTQLGHSLVAPCSIREPLAAPAAASTAEAPLPRHICSTHRTMNPAGLLERISHDKRSLLLGEIHRRGLLAAPHIAPTFVPMQYINEGTDPLENWGCSR